jgi:hypothetical protein
MMKEIDADRKGDLRTRLMKVTFGETGIMSQKQFTVLIND